MKFFIPFYLLYHSITVRCIPVNTGLDAPNELRNDYEVNDDDWDDMPSYRSYLYASYLLDPLYNDEEYEKVLKECGLTSSKNFELSDGQHDEDYHDYEPNDESDQCLHRNRNHGVCGFQLVPTTTNYPVIEKEVNERLDDNYETHVVSEKGTARSKRRESSSTKKKASSYFSEPNCGEVALRQRYGRRVLTDLFNKAAHIHGIGMRKSKGLKRKEILQALIDDVADYVKADSPVIALDDVSEYKPTRVNYGKVSNKASQKKVRQEISLRLLELKRLLKLTNVEFDAAFYRRAEDTTMPTRLILEAYLKFKKKARK